MARSRTSRRTRSAPVASTVAAKYVVYVHGICRHEAGYSIPWFSAMKPYVQDIPDANRREVLWSDIIHPQAVPALERAQVLSRETLALMHPGPPSGQEADVILQIKDVLADRAQRQYLEASVQSLARDSDAGAAPSMTTLSTVAPQAMFGIPGLECIEDFGAYLLDRNIRDQVIARFHEVVRPLLEEGARLEVISHSWGTVVAYEALRLVDSEDVGAGAVHTFFTVGSALAIPPVKRQLITEAIDGARPRRVQNWANLDAHFDIVGGPLQGVPFAVDHEYLGLTPVGCPSFIPNPACAHSSYFNVQNVAVNRDIFGHWIEI